MRCPYCGNFDDKVLDSRTMVNNEGIRRRRECLSCGYRFTSYERVYEKPFMVIKRDGRRQPFDREKLSVGLQHALKKRPISSQMIEQLLIDIEELAVKHDKESREISTSDLGEIVLGKLSGIDKVAYIRFASVYKHFENLDEFIKEVKNIKKEGK